MPHASDRLRRIFRFESTTALRRRLMQPIARLDYVDRPWKIHICDICAAVRKECSAIVRRKQAFLFASRQILPATTCDSIGLAFSTRSPTCHGVHAVVPTAYPRYG